MNDPEIDMNTKGRLYLIGKGSSKARVGGKTTAVQRHPGSEQIKASDTSTVRSFVYQLPSFKTATNK
jgi:hypothetical protein